MLSNIPSKEGEILLQSCLEKAALIPKSDYISLGAVLIFAILLQQLNKYNKVQIE